MPQIQGPPVEAGQHVGGLGVIAQQAREAVTGDDQIVLRHAALTSLRSAGGSSTIAM